MSFRCTTLATANTRETITPEARTGHPGQTSGTTQLSRGLVEDALDLAAVDVEFPGDGALAVARLIPLADGPLQGWRSPALADFLCQRRGRLVLRFGFIPPARAPCPVRISIISS